MKRNLIKNYIKAYCSFILVRIFKYKYDKSVIPQDTPYCYTFDEERTKKMKEDGKDGYAINTCPYFISFGKQCYSACRYCGFVGFDFAHWDACKICGEGKDY